MDMDPHGSLLSVRPRLGTDVSETSGSVSCITNGHLDVTSHWWQKVSGEDPDSKPITGVCSRPIGIAFDDTRETLKLLHEIKVITFHCLTMCKAFPCLVSGIWMNLSICSLVSFHLSVSWSLSLVLRILPESFLQLQRDTFLIRALPGHYGVP